MRKALTAKTIEALKPGSRRYDVHDVLCPGLSIQVGKQGQKTYTVKYRYGLKQRRLRIGVHPRVSLAQARDKAMEALRLVDDGIDPAALRRKLGNMHAHTTAVGASSSLRMVNAISEISSEAISLN